METSDNENPFEGENAHGLYGHQAMERILRSTSDDFVTKYKDLKQQVKGIGIGTHIATSTQLNAGFAVLWWVPESYLDNLSASLKVRFGWIESHLGKELTRGMAMIGSGLVATNDEVRRESDI